MIQTLNSFLSVYLPQNQHSKRVKKNHIKVIKIWHNRSKIINALYMIFVNRAFDNITIIVKLKITSMAKHIISKNPEMTKHVTTAQVITNIILKCMVPAKRE